MFKKILYLFLICIVLLTGCGNTESGNEISNNNIHASSENIIESEYIESSYVESSLIDETEDELTYMDINDLDSQIAISNGVIEGFFECKGKGFNRSLDDNYHIIVGELTNISEDVVDLNIYYTLYDENYDSFVYGVYEHPYLKPNEKALITFDISGDADAKYYTIEGELFEASKSYSDLYDTMKIVTKKESNGSISYKITSDGADSIGGNLTIFFYDDDNNIVATDESGFGGELPIEFEFDSPNCKYSKYLLSYVEY